MNSGSLIAQIMNLEGPVVKLVMLKTDGSMQEETVDMSPKKNNVGVLLGGPATFVGQLEDVQVIIMKLRAPPSKTPWNKHRLPAPFDDEKVKGDMILVRMDDNAVPQDFTVEEYCRVFNLRPLLLATETKVPEQAVTSTVFTEISNKPQSEEEVVTVKAKIEETIPSDASLPTQKKKRKKRQKKQTRAVVSETLETSETTDAQ